ncbi:MAG TPA: LysM peptidoglycan-binding domain-containing protein, partial [Deltaproteobacteria bacterium]|nr:LysM peptidoglycan-binding domain-containing protein [Deltaproteobacteria bacterium]
PAILKALKEAGLPEELSWLPLIESAFKVRALSSARALGLWQFIASTGYRYGLNRDRWVDERMDPEKSTAAAIAYLKDLHQIFGDWYTALAAYNCGEGRVLRCIKTQRINYLDHFWDLYEKLPSETAFYVPKYLAVLHILKDPAAYGFVLPPVDKEIQTDVVVTNRQVNLRVMADNIGVPYEELRDLNPDLRYSSTPPGEYSFRMPRGKETLLASVFEKLPEWQPPVPDSVIHRVRKGETLSGISKKYRTSVGAIMGLNGLRSTKYLKVGWNLKIPVGKQYASAKQTVSPSRQQSVIEKSPEIYVVRNGDSLWTIANRFGTTTKAIMSLNRLSSARLGIGQPLKMPKPTVIAQSHSPGQVVAGECTVMKGDSPYTIAHKHGLSVEDLLRMNGLNSRSTIFPGQVLMVKPK